MNKLYRFPTQKKKKKIATFVWDEATSSKGASCKIEQDNACLLARTHGFRASEGVHLWCYFTLLRPSTHKQTRQDRHGVS